MKPLIFVYFLVFQTVSSQRSSISSGEITGITFVYSEETHDGYITWDPVTCLATSYKVKYKIDEGSEETVSAIPNTTVAIIPLQSVTCEKVSAQIIASVNGVGLPSEWVDMQREFNIVDGLKATQTNKAIVVEWEPYNLGETCNEAYTIQYNITDDVVSEPLNRSEPKIEIILKDDSPCTKIDIMVQAEINGFKSKPAKLNYEIGIPPVANVSLKNSDGKVLVDFIRIQNIPEKCGDFDYRVSYEDLGCFNTSFQVLPVSKDGTEGTPFTDSIVRQPGVVKNPVMSMEGEDVVLKWSPPQGAEDCNMMYSIEIDGKTSSTAQTTIKKQVELESCAEPKIAKITPLIFYNIYDDTKGISVDVPLKRDMKNVENLECSMKSSKVTCKWEKPLLSDNCEKITYKLKYYNGEQNEDDTENTTYTFDLETRLCLIWFQIQAIGHLNDNEYYGKYLEAEPIEGCK